MSVLALVLVGLSVALAVSVVMPANEPRALLISLVIGVTGSILGAFVSVALGIDDNIMTLHIPTMPVAALGALAPMLVFRSLTGTRRLRF